MLKGETYHDATKRMRASTRQLPNGRGVAIDAIIAERSLRLASVYAHSDREAAQRPAFFRSLRNFINKSTVLGIDANCVPDVQLDVKNHSRSPYNNLGADELQDIIVNQGQRKNIPSGLCFWYTRKHKAICNKYSLLPLLMQSHLIMKEYTRSRGHVTQQKLRFCDLG